MTNLACVMLLMVHSPLQSTSAIQGLSAADAVRRGNEALRQGDIQQARALFAYAASRAPRWSLAQLHLGIAELRAAPQSPQGLAALERAVDLNPDNPRAHYYLGLAQQNARQFQKAASAFAKCLELRPRFRDARFRLAQALEEAGDPAAAVVAYQQALRVDPRDVGSLSGLARVYESSGEILGAERALRTITESYPDIAYHYQRLAQFYERTGQPHKARQAQRQAERIEPRNHRRMRPLRRSRK